MSTFFLHEQRYRDLSTTADRLVTICGAGAIGANLTETLARMGLRRLRVIDRDTIETHNLSTQPWHTQDIGTSKARVLANMLYRAVAARVEARHLTLTPENASEQLTDSTLIIDAFDNVPSRRAVAEAATVLDVPCLHLALGSGGDYGCGLWDSDYRLPHEAGLGGDACDYPLTRPLAQIVAAAGAEIIIDFLLSNARHGFDLTLRDLRLTRR